MSTRAAVIPGPRPKLTARAALLAVLMVSTGIASIVPVREYLDQRGRMADLERQAAALQETNQGLRAQMERLRDPAYLERLARECLGMVMPGEIAFITVDEEGTGTPSVC